MKVNRSKVITSAVLVLAAAALIAPLGAAADPIHACVSRKGKVRIVAQGVDCKSKESPLDWGSSALLGVVRVDFSSRANSDSPKKAFALCPAGTKLVGGGGRTVVAGGTSAPLGIRSSLPDEHMHGWAVTAEEMVPTAATWYVNAYALCATITQ